MRQPIVSTLGGFLQFLGIVICAIFAAIFFGIAHDQITARISLEYFTIGHHRLFAHNNPTIHALAWGVIATWWVGLGLGLMLATAARIGRTNTLSVKETLPYIARITVACAIGAILAGIVSWGLAASNMIHLSGWWSNKISPEQHRGFLIASYIHSTSYLVGGLGGIWAFVQIVRVRRRMGTA